MLCKGITATSNWATECTVIGVRRHWISIIGFVASASAASLTRSPGPDLGRAEEFYRGTQYTRAIDALQALPAKDAAAYALLGKSYFMDGQFKEAVANLERAVTEDSLNSDYYDWLGRAYGRIAERSSFLSALKYAKKTVHAFQRAVELSPSNLEALSDLFEYYVEAPGIAGGGLDKAEDIARRFESLNQAEYHWARARLAEKRKDLAAAETELRAAMTAEPNQVGRMLDLAAFLSSRGRYGESEALFRAAGEQYPNAPKVLYARAAANIQSKRKLDEAETLLGKYLQSQITPDDPSRKEAGELIRSAQNLRAKSSQAE